MSFLFVLKGEDEGKAEQVERGEDGATDKDDQREKDSKEQENAEGLLVSTLKSNLYPLCVFYS